MRPIPPGTHIRSPRTFYYHHGVTSGWVCDVYSPVIAHLAGDRPRDVSTARVRIGSLAEFSDGHPVEIVRYGALPFPPDQIAARSRERLGELGYDLLFNNCEHFARWAMTGERASRQVARTRTDLGASTLAMAGAIADLGLVTWSGSQHFGAARIMVGLSSVGGPLHLGPAATVAVLSAIPTALAVPLVGVWYQDDVFAPEEERRARAAARQVLLPVAAGASLTITSLISLCGYPGLSAAGIASGLKAVGTVLGGRMLSGVLLSLLTPIGATALGAWLVYQAMLRSQRQQRNTVRSWPSGPLGTWV
jgi:Lecithin retinol acyltransferase